jgi:acrylyl-CoA reductase (NADPH)
MNAQHSPALWLEEPGRPACWREVAWSDPAEGEVVIAVTHSSLNYKDALALTGRGRVVRRFPMVPGIDLTGTVVASADPRWREGQSVFAVGRGLGEEHWGGLATGACVPGAWLRAVPPGWTGAGVMAVGTAGFTAALAVEALVRAGVRGGTDERPVVVTGAAGGVGSWAVALLAAAGYRVAAATGRPELENYLRELGAREVVGRGELAREGRELENERWAGGIDTVGGRTLATLLAGTARDGAVAACGLAGGAAVPTTVFPFILRGVSLVGINSTLPPAALADAAWERALAPAAREQVARLAREVDWRELPACAEDLLAGRVRGRLVAVIAPFAPAGGGSE